jgi:hypothetical protein
MSIEGGGHAARREPREPQMAWRDRLTGRGYGDGLQEICLRLPDEFAKLRPGSHLGVTPMAR